MKLPDMDQKSCIASPASGSESWGGGGGDPSDSPRNQGDFLIESDAAVSRWMFSGFDLLQGVWFVHLRLEKISFFFQKYHLFRIESLWVDFRRVHRLQLLKVCNQYVTIPNSPAYIAYPKNNPGKTFFPNWWILDWSFEEIG